MNPNYSDGLLGFESFSSESFTFRSWHEFEDSSGEYVLLVGGGSELVIFSKGDLAAPVVKRIEPDKITKRTCERTGETATNCNNFIRSISKCEGRDEIAFCGTNAFKPKFYSVTLANLYKDNPEFNVRSGDAICPSSATTSRSEHIDFIYRVTQKLYDPSRKPESVQKNLLLIEMLLINAIYN